MRGPGEILYLLPFRFPSATAHSIQVLRTCRALAEEGARVRLMVKRNPAQRVKSAAEGLAHYGIDPHPGLEIEIQPASNPIGSLLSRWKVRRAAKGTVFYARHLRLAIGAAKRGPTVVELHAIEKDTARAVKAAHGVVTITSALRDALKTDKPVEVIPDGVDPSLFAPVEGSSDPRLVYTGQFHEWKGVDVMIRALRELRGVTALVIGGQPGKDERRDALQKLAVEEGVADRVEWAGFVPQREVRVRLRGGDIGVMPTRAQNGQEIAASPLKLFEYMSLGLPIVATDLPSVRDVVRDGGNGLLFPDGDAGALAGAVRRLLERPEERSRIAARAREDAQQYSWRGRARRILSFLERVCPA